jgi:hypothetical protein
MFMSMQSSKWRSAFAILTSVLLLFSSFSPLVQVVLAEASTEPVEEVQEMIPEEDNTSGSITEEAVMTENLPNEETSEAIAPSIWNISDDELTATTNANVIVGETYIAPFNPLLTVRFTEINNDGGTLTLAQLFLTDEERNTLGSVSNIAYEALSTMQDGTFKYVMTLPTGDMTESTVDVKYVENRDELSSALTIEDLSRVGGYVTLSDMDHFTLFTLVTEELPLLSDTMVRSTHNTITYFRQNFLTQPI